MACIRNSRSLLHYVVIIKYNCSFDTKISLKYTNILKILLTYYQTFKLKILPYCKVLQFYIRLSLIKVSCLKVFLCLIELLKSRLGSIDLSKQRMKREIHIKCWSDIKILVQMRWGGRHIGMIFFYVKDWRFFRFQ